MSKALDNAELIRTRLLTAPAVGEIPTSVDLTTLTDEIIIDRQKSILPTVRLAVAKAGGTAISILWLGGRVADANARTPRIEHRYTVTVWSKPIIAGGNLPADDVVESAINRLWHWRPQGGHAFGEARPENVGMVPDKSFLIYDFEVVIPISH